MHSFAPFSNLNFFVKNRQHFFANEKMNWIFHQTSRGSFSAVSTPIFASKYSLESSRRDLHNALLCTVLQSQNFSQKSSTFFRDWIIEFPIFSISSSNFAFFLRNFDEFFPDFAPNSRKEWGLSLFNQFCENELENYRNFWKFWKLFNFIQFYSIVSLIGRAQLVRRWTLMKKARLAWKGNFCFILKS